MTVLTRSKKKNPCHDLFTSCKPPSHPVLAHANAFRESLWALCDLLLMSEKFKLQPDERSVPTLPLKQRQYTENRATFPRSLPPPTPQTRHSQPPGRCIFGGQTREANTHDRLSGIVSFSSPQLYAIPSKANSRCIWIRSSAMTGSHHSTQANAPR